MKRVLIVLRNTYEELQKSVKYLGIIKTFSELGFEVYYTYLEGNKVYINSNGNDSEIGNVVMKKLYRYTRNISIYNAVTNFLQKTETVFDLCYIRSFPAMPGQKKMYRAINHKCKRLVVEIPTYTKKSEISSDKRFVRRIYKNVMDYIDKKNSKYVDLFALIGEESNEYCGRPAVNICNGIDLSSIKIRNIKNTSPDTLNILTVAKYCRWHGYDRLINGLIKYKKDGGNEHIIIHMVGPDGDGTLGELKKTVYDVGLGEDVVFYGPLYGEEINSLYDISDVAINSIGFHRIGINTFAFNLKLAEYIARGIPVACEMTEDSVGDEIPFLTKCIPADDTSVNMNDLILKIREDRKHPEHNKVMREYAEKNLSWKSQIEIILDGLGKE